MFEYLYYKLYQAALKSSLNDIPNIAAACWLSALLSLNLFLIDALLAKTTSFPWLFKNYKVGGWFAFMLIILLVLFFSKKRRTVIIDKYSGENNTQRIRGNIAVAIYVALSLILTFVVAFYRPGKF